MSDERGKKGVNFGAKARFDDISADGIEFAMEKGEVLVSQSKKVQSSIRRRFRLTDSRCRWRILGKGNFPNEDNIDETDKEGYTIHR